MIDKSFHTFCAELDKLADDDSTKGAAPSEEQVLTFIKKNPRPTDEQFHMWAEAKGFNKHKAEQVAYRIISDLLHKGRSKGKAPAGVAKADVKKGVAIEAEHTPNKMIQRKITDDHNAELTKYYDKKKGLPAMEKKLEKSAAFIDELSKLGAGKTLRGIPLSVLKAQTPAKPTPSQIAKIQQVWKDNNPLEKGVGGLGASVSLRQSGFDKKKKGKTAMAAAFMDEWTKIGGRLSVSPINRVKTPGVSSRTRNLRAAGAVPDKKGDLRIKTLANPSGWNASRPGQGGIWGK